MISKPLPSRIILVMKLSWKVRFHGPLLSPLHHFTAFTESDSTIIWLLRGLPMDNEIRIALWIASTSAWLISISGIGVEKRHKNFPNWSRRTPPMADFASFAFRDASTFHLREEKLGGDQALESRWDPRDWWERVWGDQSRHLRFLMISFGL